MPILAKHLASSALVCLAGLAAAAAQAGDYGVTQRLSLGAETKWDYAAFDAARQRLYVTRGDHVDVIAIPSGAAVGSIPNTQGVHGVAFAPEFNLGFTSNGKANSITVFDIESLKPAEEIALAGKNPDALLYEAGLKQLYVFNGSSASVDVIDVATRKLVGSLKTAGRPEFAVSDGHGKIYFHLEEHVGGIQVIDTASGKIAATWALEGCEAPTGLAIDAMNSRLFSACHNGLMVVTDANTGRRVAQFPIGQNPDAVIYDADTKTVLTSSGGGIGTLNVVNQTDADHYAVRANVVTEKGAKTMAMNPLDKTVYLPTAVGNAFVVVVVARAH